MTTVLNVDIRTIDPSALGKLSRREISEYIPKREVRVYDDPHGYEQLLQVARIVQDGEAGSGQYVMYLDDGAAIPLDVYTNPLAVSVTFAHSPF